MRAMFAMIDYVRALVAARRAPMTAPAAPAPASVAPAAPGKRRKAKPRRPRGLVRLDAAQSILSQVRN